MPEPSFGDAFKLLLHQSVASLTDGSAVSFAVWLWLVPPLIVWVGRFIVSVWAGMEDTRGERDRRAWLAALEERERHEPADPWEGPYTYDTQKLEWPAGDAPAPPVVAPAHHDAAVSLQGAPDGLEVTVQVTVRRREGE